ncbi:hypothetical protein KCU61_g5682, partial [Aureobasidium melanogenum]
MVRVVSAMHYLSSHGRVMYTLLFLLPAIARGQTTTAFPAPALYPDGAFLVPDTVRLPILDQGTLLNVTWTTTYENVNLYLIFGGDYNQPKALTIGTTDTFFPWTVDDAGNNSLPFTFRAVNATGTSQQQASGGFITGQFWIRDNLDSTPVATQTTTHTDFQSSAMPTTTTASETSSSVSGVKSGGTVSTTASTSSDESTSPGSGKPSTSVSSQSASATSMMSGPTSSSSEISASGTITKMTSPAQIQNSNPGPSTGAVAGIVIGAVAVLAIIIGVSLFFRRQRRPTTSSRHSDSMDIQMAQQGHSDLGKTKYTIRDSSWDSSRKGLAELQEDQLVELPNYRSSRQHELP